MIQITRQDFEAALANHAIGNGNVLISDSFGLQTDDVRRLLWVAGGGKVCIVCCNSLNMIRLSGFFRGMRKRFGV